MQDAVILKSGRDKPIRQRHPWIFSGSIQQLPAATRVHDGDIVPVLAGNGQWLAWGYLNRRSQIQVRLLSWDRDADIDDDDFWRQRLQTAIEQRSDLAQSSVTDVYRLVHAESDYLPGLTVDRYGAYLVMQVGTLGMDRRKQRIADLLLALTGCTGVIERSDMTARRQEGLSTATGLLAGAMPPEQVAVREEGLLFTVDLIAGQKTGFYIDQRVNRQLVGGYCADKRVLNAFSYTSAFAVHALAAGARHITNVDTSFEALELGEENVRANSFDPDIQTEHIAGDIFEVLRDWRDYGTDAQKFDVIILDPPKFAQSQRNMDRALRGYKDINLLAMQLLTPSGILATFSCSGLVSADLFQKVIFGAAVDAGRPVQILEWLHQGTDHPVAVTFPEGAYLKGFVCRVL